ncbi:GNAT family N-acetyltransferase [Lactococcus allomyrinae]|uniref:N-acetyltransferase n=1 Tax=Lactococcus allomyrinae TaxID=2419773 RepID=A0A387BC98_9LACT|nr:GNAT family protein [Lactococcus allomyrinae]AYG00078.1 N-acetyltransferase [Lactococcus allomyrinae]
MTAESEVTIRSIQKADLHELWAISYGQKADLTWMAYNGPYFQNPILTWEEFSAKIAPKINQSNFALIIYENQIVGQLSSHWYDGDLQNWLEFGLVIYDSRLWGKGIGAAAVRLWMRQLFDTYPEIQHLGFTTWSGNPGMMKLGEKCGLQREGQIRKVRFWQGNWYDSVKYGILREEL